MATLGIDLGNYNVKTSSEVIFSSRVTTKENLLDNSKVLVLNGIKYFVGSGELEINLNKSSKENTLALLYAAILESTKDTVVNIVVGLPISQFKENKDVFKANLIQSKFINLSYCGEPRAVILNNLEVFPEGMGAYLSLKNRPRNCIIVDIGGRTTNIIEIKNNKYFKGVSLVQGMINLYSNIKDQLNSKYTLNLGIEDIETALKEGLYVDGEKVDMSFMKSDIKNMIDALMNELNLNYPIRTTEVLLSGGGAFLLNNILTKKIGRLTLVDDYLFSNAKGFKKVGANLWKEDE